MRHPLFPQLSLLSLLLAACSASSEAPSVAGLESTPDPLTASQVYAAPGGMAEAAMGAYAVSADLESLTGSVTPLRSAARQGDLYLLSPRPFFGPRDVQLVQIGPGPEAGRVMVTVRFSHPFAAPADLVPPASSTKRIDLHLFDVTALVVTPGTDTFNFGEGPLATNGSLLRNADGYRDPGSTFNRSTLGAASTNLFPYRLVAKGIDPLNPLGNYQPGAHGWTGSALLSPTGFDVFPQGSSVDVTFDLDATSGAIDFVLVPVAKYMDPRATPNPKAKRLPEPGNPASLRYLLPEAAGDVQHINATVSGFLRSGISSDIVLIDLTVLDWDHGASVAPAFPDPSNPSLISENSNVLNVSLSAPQLATIAPFPGTAPLGTAPLITSSVSLNNEDLFNPTTTVDVLGLLRVQDTQDQDDATDTTLPIVLNESLQPVTRLSSTRYQVVRIPVVPTAVLGNITPDPVPGVGINADMGSTAINIGSPAQTRVIAVQGNGDVYCGVHSASPNTIRIYRSTDDGRTWLNPAATLTSYAGGAAAPSANGFSIGVMANGLPSLAAIDTGNDLTYLACQSESGGLVNYGAVSNGVEIETAGTYRQPIVLPSRTIANTAYVLVRNTSTTLGHNPSRLTLYQTTNAFIHPAVFTQLPGPVDTGITALPSANVAAAIDGANNLHIVWEIQGAASVDEIYYRKWLHGTPGSWDGAPVLLTGAPYADGGLTEVAISINSNNEPVVAWIDDMNGSATQTAVFLTKFTTGDGWSLPIRISNTSGAAPGTNNPARTQLAIDTSNRIHAVWDDDRMVNGRQEIWGALLTPSGQFKLVEDFAIIPSIAGETHTQGRVGYSNAGNRVIVAGLNSTAIATGRARYQTYAVTPP
ncbi:MAG: hypothetical protein GEEBNDBF_00431 [bacterium]|nr:hypothetical protein [bacterium]